ncbi:hypothetical protein LWI29_014526 [Acer saccharum]|uniref:Cytochrome P450 n=1 Tax=Acer saccharum TaxID=4024 RepID=A0AA39VZ10_ACESA|nr:hypothetical protein LWI29_014526 [Acer saccharum]KAK1575850.1 hypothetical protein Q3G72_008887 [Acer saccharum]
MISNFLSELCRLVIVFWSWWCDGLTQNSTTRVIPTLVAATLLAISLYAWLIKKPFISVPPLPPGPPGLPLLGNLPFLEPNLHRYFAKLSEIYGPIMKLQLGRKLCVVISSPSLAKQVLKDHGAIFANRDPTVAATASTYGGIDILWSPSHDPEWRKLRKIFVQEMISKPSLDACYPLRRQEVRKMVKDVYSKVGSSINIGEQMFITILNVIMSMSWGSSLNEEDRSRVGIQFRQAVDEFIELWGAPNISDLFPVLARFDLQGIESKMKKLSSWFDRILESLIDSRTKDHQAGGENKDFLEILLDLMQQGDDKTSLSMNQVKALLLVRRRICPGIPLAEKMLLYVASTFLHSFEWNLPHGTTLDLSEKFGLVMKMQEPLIAIPIAKYSSPEHYL